MLEAHEVTEAVLLADVDVELEAFVEDEDASEVAVDCNILNRRRQIRNTLRLPINLLLILQPNLFPLSNDYIFNC